VRGIRVGSGAGLGGVDGKDEVLRMLVPRQIRQKNPKAGMKKGIVKDYRFYTEEWNEQFGPKQ